MSSPPCGECGAPVEVLEIPALGERIVPPFCRTCSARFAEEDAAAERERALDEALHRAGATPKLLRWTLDTYPEDLHAQRDAALEWAFRFTDEDSRRNLWLFGPLGTGKTGLAWSVARRLIELEVAEFFADPPDHRPAAPRGVALFVNWRDLLAELKESFRADQRSQRGGADPDPSVVLDRASRVEVLVLDDLGGERPTPFALDALATLVEHRYQAETPTIVTSNYSTKELASRLGQGEDVVGARIVERLLDGAVGIRFEGQSRRRIGGSA